MTTLIRIAERVLNRPLLVHPDKVPLILSVLSGRIPIDENAIAGLRAEAEQRIDDLPDDARAIMRGPVPGASRFVGSRYFSDADTGQSGNLPYRRTREGVALIPVIGGLVNRGTSLEQSSMSDQSYEGLKFQIAHAADDPKTIAVLLDMESPGGEAVGAFEAADAVRALAAIKPVHAVVNGMAASAAYAIASAASKIWTTSTGVSGSIGVVMMHADFSRALDKQGVTPTLIHAGAHKVDGNPFEPLSKDVKNDLQAEVNQFYEMFVETVAKGRKAMSPKSIRATEARTFIGADAVREGLADEVGSFETALAALSSRGNARNTRQKGKLMADDNGAAAVTAETATPATTAAAPAAASAATVDAAANEQARIRAILTSDEAKGRDALAQHLAFNTRMSADEAKVMMAVAPAAAPAASSAAPAKRASESPIGIVVADAQPAAPKSASISTASIYQKRAAEMNKGVNA
jgi:signal peptide peptidase SppA